MTSDPYQASGGAAEPGSWNRYGYVAGDPVNWGDPSGLLKCEIVSTIVDGSRATVGAWCKSTGGTKTEIFSVEMASDLSEEKRMETVLAAVDAVLYDLELQDSWAYARLEVVPFLRNVLETNQECRNLFGGGASGGWNPTDVLRNLLFTQDGRYGSLTFAYLSAGAAGLTFPGFLRGDIVIDIGGFLNYYIMGTELFRDSQLGYSASTILHELAHLYNFSILRGSGGFAISNLLELVDEEAFSKVIKDKCGIF